MILTRALLLRDWETEGAAVATNENIDARIAALGNGQYDTALVVANRYDGIDLPDNTCRILILDGKPFGDNLFDRYVEFAVQERRRSQRGLLAS